MKTTSIAHLAAELFGDAAQFEAGCGHPFDDKRFDPEFSRGLDMRVPTPDEAVLRIDRFFPRQHGSDQRALPNLADLQWLKQLSRVLRQSELVAGSHSLVLNAMAGFWGYRSYGALEQACHAYLESASERTHKLPALAIIACEQLGVDVSSTLFVELVLLALGIPCLTYEFLGYPESAVAPKLTLYANGMAHVQEGKQYPTLYGYLLDELGLCAVDYSLSQLPSVTSLRGLKSLPSPELKLLVKCALWTSDPVVTQYQLRDASDDELEDAISTAMPMSHFVVLTHRANADLMEGLSSRIFGLPAFYDFANAVAVSATDGFSLMASEPIQDSDSLTLVPLSDDGV